MTGFVLPPYPYDRLDELRSVADGFPGGAVDLSVGTPTDPPPPFAAAVLAGSDAERGYPASVGTRPFRDAAAAWLERRLGVELGPDDLAACIGTKELVAGLPHWLHLRAPDRDVVLYPATSYPSYAMGAELARCRAVPVPATPDGTLDLDAVDETDAARALCLWVNSPGNPTGALDDLPVAAAWGRAHGVPVFSDECYVEFTWAGPPRTILSSGLDGVVAVHSISKRSNLAGVRAGFYAGDADLVAYLRELRKHAGFMVPGPVQALAAASWLDDEHVDRQRAVYRARLARLREILAVVGIASELPAGAFYLWVPAPDGDGWNLTKELAASLGMIVSPGEFYGDAAADHVRIAAVQPDEQIELLAHRAGG